MRLIGIRFTLLAFGAIAAFSGISCNQHSTSGKHTTAANAKPGPEESFETIMEMFRRRMEETPIGFVVSDASSRSTLTGTNKVSHELVKPANAGEQYKAIVTVTSQSRYRVARTKEDDDSDRDKEKEKDAKNDKLPTDSADENGKSLDPAVSLSGDSARSRSGSIAGERTAIPSSDSDERKYELVYEDGRWKLVTTLNPETEQSVQNAFKNALDTQL